MQHNAPRLGFGPLLLFSLALEAGSPGLPYGRRRGREGGTVPSTNSFIVFIHLPVLARPLLQSCVGSVCSPLTGLPLWLATPAALSTMVLGGSLGITAFFTSRTGALQRQRPIWGRHWSLSASRCGPSPPVEFITAPAPPPRSSRDHPRRRSSCTGLGRPMARGSGLRCSELGRWRRVSTLVGRQAPRWCRFGGLGLKHDGLALASERGLGPPAEGLGQGAEGARSWDTAVVRVGIGWRHGREALWGREGHAR
mmetsp:Transcript_18691/g.54456  ORF Transcript_18691/g.54456 Transcript_18691/m.54456 type:complete len:253 (-) Transcript_18691:482-1240(-)